MLIDGDVLCNWSTSSEFDLDYMEVQRKTTSTSDFETINTTPSKNIHHIATDYNFTDDQPSAGRNIYRLKMVSKSGVVAYSLEETIFLIEKSTVNFSPNPTASLLTFLMIPEVGTINIEVYTPNGQLIKTTAWEAEDQVSFTLDVENLPNGIYFFSIQNGEIRKGGKFIKQ